MSISGRMTLRKGHVGKVLDSPDFMQANATTWFILPSGGVPGFESLCDNLDETAGQ